MKNRTTNGDSEEIKASIEQTRAEMDGTLDALSERLQPRHILDDILDYFQSRRRSSGARDSHRVKQAAGRVKEKASHAGRRAKEGTADAGRYMLDQVREHPVPALLIGAGIACLLMERKRHEYSEVEYYAVGEEMDSDIYAQEGDPGHGFDEGYAQGTAPESYALPTHYAEGSSGGMGEKIRSAGTQLKRKAQDVKERAARSLYRAKEGTAQRTEDLRHRASEKAAYMKERAAEKAARLREQAHHTYDDGVEAFKQTADEHPLAVGLGFLALGVVAGMLLPSTRREDEMVGPVRDRLVNRSREVASEAARRGKEVARATAEAVKTEAQAQGLTPEALKEKGKHVLESAKATAQQEGLTADALKQKAQKVGEQAKETSRQETKHAADSLKQT